LVAYSHFPSGDAARPTGCTPSGTKPARSAGPNPRVSARARLNTAMSVVCCRVTNANRPSGEVTTLTAPSPRGLVSRPTTGSRASRSALATLMTTAPRPPAASRYRPSGVMARPLAAPPTRMVPSSVSTGPSRNTAMPAPRVTKTNRRSVVSWVAKGRPPTVIRWPAALASVGARPTARLQPGAGSATTARWTVTALPWLWPSRYQAPMAMTEMSETTAARDADQFARPRPRRPADQDGRDDGSDGRCRPPRPPGRASGTCGPYGQGAGVSASASTPEPPNAPVPAPPGPRNPSPAPAPAPAPAPSALSLRPPVPAPPRHPPDVPAPP